MRQTEHRFEVDAQCGACDGTGLYVGMAERDGAAVVCHSCKGTGKVRRVFEWKDFTERKPRAGVLWVIERNPGISVGADKDGEFALSDFGGMSYSEWRGGHAFPAGSEMRKFVCPAWWYQSVDYSKKPHWDECIGCGSFSGCKQFGNKAACWEKWDAEYGQERM